MSVCWMEVEGRKILDDPKPAYMEFLSGRLREEMKSARPLEGMVIVIDYGSGTSGFIGRMFERLGAEVVDILSQPNAEFPIHMPDPNDAENLELLQHYIKELNKQDQYKGKKIVGFAFDTDADRFGAVTGTGKVCGGNYLLAVLSRGACANRQGDSILFNCRACPALVPLIRELGGNPVWGHTGYGNLRQDMKKEAKRLEGEESDQVVAWGGEDSGHVLFPDNEYFDDGMYTACKGLMAMGKTGKNLDEYHPTHGEKEHRGQSC